MRFLSHTKHFTLLLALSIGLFTSVDSHALPEVKGFATGNQTLRALEKIRGRQVVSTVVGIAGFYGQDQPAQWLVLSRDPKARNLLHEYAMTNGKIVGERHFSAQPEWDIPTIPIPLGNLRVDSPRAFGIAEANARRAGIGFDSVHYQLRCRDLRNEPVWVLNMIDQLENSVGVQYISAVTGETLRSVWYRPGSLEYTQVNEKRQGLIDNLGRTVQGAGKTLTNAGKSIAEKVTPNKQQAAPVPMRTQYRPTTLQRPAPAPTTPRPQTITPQRRAVTPIQQRR